MEKIDTSPEEEAIKNEAREFMSEIVPTEEATAPTSSEEVNGAEIVKAWKSIYAGSDDDKEAKFWAAYDPSAASIWTMTYDEADSNESVEQTVEIVTNFIGQAGMESIKDECFGIVYVLENLEIEGIWLFNGPDPEKMFGANQETSWYTWNQLGPEATDKVKAAVAKYLMPADGKLNDKAIKDTQVFN
jgi:Elongation factor 1 gamma, conserved domain